MTSNAEINSEAGFYILLRPIALKKIALNENILRFAVDQRNPVFQNNPTRSYCEHIIVADLETPHRSKVWILNTWEHIKKEN